MSEKKSFLSGLFGGKKSGGCCNMEIVEEKDTDAKTEEPTPACACDCNCSASETNDIVNDCCDAVKGGICCIKVLGTGCKNCHILLENTKEAMKAMGLSIEVEYITDMQKIMEYGIMSTPALVVNEKVVSSGKVLKSGDVEKLLHKLGF